LSDFEASSQSSESNAIEVAWDVAFLLEVWRLSRAHTAEETEEREGDA
jgi:hypothetical protein